MDASGTKRTLPRARRCQLLTQRGLSPRNNVRIVAAQNDGRNAIPHSAGRRDEENLWFSTFCTSLHGCVVGEWTEPNRKPGVGRVAKLSLPHQYRVRYGQQAFPSLERHNPKRTCLLDYGPCLPACGIPMLAFYIRSRRAYDDLRAHPIDKDLKQLL